MATATETMECLCGACGPCRRMIRDEERAMKAATVRQTRAVLSDEAKAEWERVNRRAPKDLPGLRRLMQRPSPFTE